MGVLDELESAAQQVLETAGGAVVGVGRRWRGGSGVVIEEGLVLTNAHNLSPEHPVEVAFGADHAVEAEVLGRDDEGDLALLRVDTGSRAPLPIPRGEGRVAPGQVVFALSNPGGRGVRIGFGLVAAVGRSFRGPAGWPVTGAIEHGAPAPRGASGGPVVDRHGALLGLDTHRLEGGLYAAIPADESLAASLDALRQGSRPPRARLGVVLAPSVAARRLRRAVGLPEREGLLVRAVMPESPAATAGIRQGDLLVHADGTDLRRPPDLWAVLGRVGETGMLSLVLVRGVEEHTVEVQLTRR